MDTDDVFSNSGIESMDCNEASRISDIGAVKSISTSEIETKSTSGTYEETLKQKLMSLQAKDLLPERDCIYLIDLLNNITKQTFIIEEMCHKLSHNSETSETKNYKVKVTKSVKDASTQTTETKQENALPSDPVSQRNYLKHQSRLGQQDQDKDGINTIMCETFADRRNFILYKGPTVRAVQECYPTLFEKDQILAEFGRITGTEIADIFYKNLQVHCKAILHYAQPTCRAKKSLGKFLDAAHTEEQKTYVNFAASLLALPSLFEEDLGKIIKFKSVKSTTDYPIIICKLDEEKALSGDASYRIYVEKTLLYTSNDVIVSFLMYMASFYIFDISYPDEITQTTALIELLLLDLHPEGTSLSTSVEEVHKLLLLFQ